MAGLSRLMMGIPKKEKGRGACLPHSARSRAVLAGRFLILGAQFSVDVLCRGGKPQRGRRIVLKIDHIITSSSHQLRTAGCLEGWNLFCSKPDARSPAPRRGEPVEGREVGGSQKTTAKKPKNVQNKVCRAHFEKCPVSFLFPHSFTLALFFARAHPPDEHTTKGMQQ